MAAIRLIAKMPTLAAFAYRHNLGLPVHLSGQRPHVRRGNFLSMLFKMTEPKYEPDPRLEQRARRPLHPARRPRAELLDQRGPRRGLLAGRPYSAVAAGVAALYGPLHGGANEAVLGCCGESRRPRNIPDFLEGVKNREERLMGFGHRVYKNYDPRAQIIKKTRRRGARGDGRQPAARHRSRAREARARRRVLHRAASSTRTSTSTRADLRGAADPDRDVHGDLRDPATSGLDRAVARDERRPRAEDRAPPPDLHGQARRRTTSRSSSATGPRRSPARRARRPARPRPGPAPAATWRVGASPAHGQARLARATRALETCRGDRGDGGHA